MKSAKILVGVLTLILWHGAAIATLKPITKVQDIKSAVKKFNHNQQDCEKRVIAWWQEGPGKAYKPTCKNNRCAKALAHIKKMCRFFITINNSTNPTAVKHSYEKAHIAFTRFCKARNEAIRAFGTHLKYMFTTHDNQRCKQIRRRAARGMYRSIFHKDLWCLIGAKEFYFYTQDCSFQKMLTHTPVPPQPKWPPQYAGYGTFNGKSPKPTTYQVTGKVVCNDGNQVDDGDDVNCEVRGAPGRAKFWWIVGQRHVPGTTSSISFKARNPSTTRTKKIPVKVRVSVHRRKKWHRKNLRTDVIVRKKADVPPPPPVLPPTPIVVVEKPKIECDPSVEECTHLNPKPNSTRQWIRQKKDGGVPENFGDGKLRQKYSIGLKPTKDEDYLIWVKECPEFGMGGNQECKESDKQTVTVHPPMRHTFEVNDPTICKLEEESTDTGKLVLLKKGNCVLIYKVSAPYPVEIQWDHTIRLKRASARLTGISDPPYRITRGYPTDGNGAEIKVRFQTTGVKQTDIVSVKARPRIGDSLTGTLKIIPLAAPEPLPTPQPTPQPQTKGFGLDYWDLFLNFSPGILPGNTVIEGGNAIYGGDWELGFTGRYFVWENKDGHHGELGFHVGLGHDQKILQTATVQSDQSDAFRLNLGLFTGSYQISVFLIRAQTGLNFAFSGDQRQDNVQNGVLRSAIAWYGQLELGLAFNALNQRRLVHLYIATRGIKGTKGHVWSLPSVGLALQYHPYIRLKAEYSLLSQSTTSLVSTPGQNNKEVALDTDGFKRHLFMASVGTGFYIGNTTILFDIAYEFLSGEKDIRTGTVHRLMFNLTFVFGRKSIDLMPSIIPWAAGIRELSGVNTDTKAAAGQGDKPTTTSP